MNDPTHLVDLERFVAALGLEIEDRREIVCSTSGEHQATALGAFMALTQTRSALEILLERWRRNLRLDDEADAGG